MPKISPNRRRVLKGLAAALVLGKVPGVVSAEEIEEANDFGSVVRRRRMIRRYEAKDIPRKTVLKLLDYASRAPSAGNLQPWEFVVVRDSEVQLGLAKAAGNQTSVVTAPVIVVTCANILRMGEQYGTRGTFYSLVDTAFASLLILLGATEQGVGACFVGSYDPVGVAEILKLPDHVRPVGLITLGYAAELPVRPAKRKIRLQQLVHEDTW